jgi:hypothetical protein
LRAATFFESLRLAPHWLRHRCDALVLVAARKVDSPLDAREGAREGAAALLVEPLARAEARGARVIATMCVEAESSGAAIDASLGEATGVSAIIDALRTHGTHAVIHAGLKITIDTKWPLETVRPTLERPLEVSLVAREEAPPSDADHDNGLVRFVSHATAGVLAFFASQRAALTLVGPTHATPRAIARRPENVVVTRASGRSATLVVDESHPYFFDHPLDHVPGILLAEGALQLVERAFDDDASYVRTLGLRFRRYCEPRVCAPSRDARRALGPRHPARPADDAPLGARVARRAGRARRCASHAPARNGTEARVRIVARRRTRDAVR